MCPRPYQMGRRKELIEASRQKIIGAARDLLAEPAPAFTIDAVARRADVARATVYYQFQSRTGLLEALCDSLAEDGGMAELAGAFTEPDPMSALRRFVECFGRFWAADRVVTRRLRALAALDPEVAAVITARDERRRQGLEVLLARLPACGPEAGRILWMLTGFETFDTLAEAGRPLTDVTPEVTALVEQALRVP